MSSCRGRPSSLRGRQRGIAGSVRNRAGNHQNGFFFRAGHTSSSPVRRFCYGAGPVSSGAGVGRTLLSDALLLLSAAAHRHLFSIVGEGHILTASAAVASRLAGEQPVPLRCLRKIKVNGVGQECPTHTSSDQFRSLQTAPWTFPGSWFNIASLCEGQTVLQQSFRSYYGGNL